MDKFSEERKRDLDKNNETLPSFLRPVNNQDANWNKSDLLV